MFLFTSVHRRANAAQPPNPIGLANLSPRETEILSLLAKGYRYKEIADELHIMVKGRMVYSATPAVFRAEEETIRARFLTV